MPLIYVYFIVFLKLPKPSPIILLYRICKTPKLRYYTNKPITITFNPHNPNRTFAHLVPQTLADAFKIFIYSFYRLAIDDGECMLGTAVAR